MASISTLVDLVKIQVMSSGTGPFLLGPEVPGFRGVEALTGGATYSYSVQIGAQYEVGTGVYLAETQTFVRSPNVSSSGNAAVAFPANVQLTFTARAADLVATGGTLPIVDSEGVGPDVAISQRAATEGIGQKVQADAIGIPATDANMGTTPGTILSDNGTAKDWFGEAEAAIEGRVPRLASRAALAAFPAALSAIFGAAFLSESGREGSFVWSSANHSADVTADPGQGVFLPPSADTTGASGAWVRKLEGYIRPQWFGAAADGVTGDAVAIERAIDLINHLGGGKLLLSGGAFLVDATINPVITNDLVVEFRGGKLVADTGLNVPVLNIRGASVDQASPNDIHLRIVNPNIDCSDGDSSTPGAQQCTAINFNYLKTAIVEGGYLYGGEEPDNTNADSAITWVTCGEVKVIGTTMRGFNDAGVYPGGNNTTTTDGDGGTGLLLGCTIQRCNVAVTAKRQMTLLQVVGGVVEECVSGVTSQLITSPGNVAPARRLDVKDVKFRKIKANAVHAKAITKLTVKGCEFEDWGYDYDGTNSAGINAYAITLEGTSGADIIGNSFKMADWTLDDQRVYNFKNITFDGVTYTHGTCFGEGNSYRNIPKIFIWSDAGNAHSFLNEYFEGITSTKISTTNLNTSTEITYREPGKYGVWHSINGIRTQLAPARTVVDADGATLTADDAKTVYVNDGAAALTVFNLPSASSLEPGDYSFQRMSGTYNVQVKAAAGDIIRLPGGTASTAGGTATSGARGDTITLRAIDSTNWIVTAIGGTWTAA